MKKMTEEQWRRLWTLMGWATEEALGSRQPSGDYLTAAASDCGAGDTLHDFVEAASYTANNTVTDD